MWICVSAATEQPSPSPRRASTAVSGYRSFIPAHADRPRKRRSGTRRADLTWCGEALREGAAMHGRSRLAQALAALLLLLPLAAAASIAFAENDTDKVAPPAANTTPPAANPAP